MSNDVKIEIVWDKIDWSRVGRRFTWGVITTLCIWALCTLVVLALSDELGVRSRDATDSPTQRSGVRLRTDYGTGCQYLETAGGGIAPRMDRTGRQICR